MAALARALAIIVTFTYCADARADDQASADDLLPSETTPIAALGQEKKKAPEPEQPSVSISIPAGYSVIPPPVEPPPSNPSQVLARKEVAAVRTTLENRLKQESDAAAKTIALGQPVREPIRSPGVSVAPQAPRHLNIPPLEMSTAFRQLQAANDLSQKALREGGLEAMKETARAAFEGSVTTKDVPLTPRGNNFFSVREAYAHSISQINVPPPVVPNSGQVGGVKMEFDEAALQAAINAAASRAGTAALEDRLVSALRSSDPVSGIRSLESWSRRSALDSRPTISDGSIAVISLRRLLEASSSYRGRWDQLPAELRNPGGIKRLRGFVIDPANGDITLLGSTAGEGDPIDIDDLVVGFSAVWKDGVTPFCSLDPDPSDLSGNQHVRIGGVPNNSSFAKTMLDADYAMKRIMAGLETVSVSGYRTLVQLMQQTPAEFTSRWWFYPVQPSTGDIQVSADQSTVLFSGDIQVLSEEEVLVRGGLVGLGKGVGIGDAAADSFTEHRHELARQRPVIGHLMGLFDIVLAARVLRSLQPSNSILAQLATLPHRQIAIPTTYRGHDVQVPNTSFRLQGGVEIRLDTSRQKWIGLGWKTTADLRARIHDVSRSGKTASALPGLTLSLPQPAIHREDEQSRGDHVVLARMTAGDLDGALQLAKANAAASPDAANARIILANVHMARGESAMAWREAALAQALAPQDRFVQEMATRLLVQSDIASERYDVAISELDQAIAREPSSTELYLLKGKILRGTGKHAEAKQAYQHAIDLDPSCAPAYAALALFAVMDGWTPKARSLASKAYALGPRRLDTKVALAVTEMSLNNMRAARDLATQGVKEAAADAGSRMMFYIVLVTSTGTLDKNVDAMDAYVRQAADLPPIMQDGVLQVAAAMADELGRADVANRYRAAMRKP